MQPGKNILLPVWLRPAVYLCLLFLHTKQPAWRDNRKRYVLPHHALWDVRLGKAIRNKTESLEIHARKLGVVGNIVTASIFVGGVVAYYFFLKNVPMFGVFDSDPFVDSITSVPAYIAQIFMVLGFREQWIYWLILDVGSVVLAIRAGSLVMTAQFIFWTLNCIYGFVNWTKLSKGKSHARS